MLRFLRIEHLAVIDALEVEFEPGLNVGRGKDDTLFAKISGRIKFLDKGSMGKFVMVEPLEAK